MGRCGGWMKIVALVLAAFTASCGDTGGKSSDSGKPFVFQTRGRLNLIAQPVITTPTVLTVIATLLDPQGNPFRNQRVTFEAEFPDATIVPANTPENVPLACLPPGSNGNATRCTNRGAAITNDLGQAQVTVIAGLTLGSMRVTAEAPANLNISSAISVRITSQGFIGGTDLAILPTAVTFVNPLVGPETDPAARPFTIFSAVGGTPPYRWDNTDKDLASIVPQGIPNINEKAQYTLIGPIPTDNPSVLDDEVRLTDSRGDSVTAPVTVIFADCTLQLSAATVNFGGVFGGETFEIKISDGVPPFTATNTFPTAGTLTVNDATGIVTYTVATPPLPVQPDNVLIRDSRGCIGTVEVTIVPGIPTVTLTADPATIDGVTGEPPSTITALAVDNNNEPLPGLTILFTTDLGTLSSATAVTGADGKATVTLTIPAGTPAGTATVSALAPNSTTPTTVPITILAGTAPPVNTLTLTAIPASLPIGGGPVTLTAVAFDIDDQPIEGATIVFSTTSGTLGAVSDVTDADGEATVTLTVEPNTTGSPLTITVTATSENGKTAQATIAQQ